MKRLICFLFGHLFKQMSGHGTCRINVKCTRCGKEAEFYNKEYESA